MTVRKIYFGSYGPFYFDDTDTYSDPDEGFGDGETMEGILSEGTATFSGVALGTGELTCGSINRASGTLTIEIGGTAEISVTSSASTFGGDVATNGDFLLTDGNYVGISGNERIEFYAAGYTLVRGLLGIGNITPTYNLQVKGQAYVYDGSIDTTASYVGITGNWTKTAGATDSSDNFFGIDSSMSINDGDSTVGHIYGMRNVATLTDGTVAQNITGLYAHGRIVAGTVDTDMFGVSGVSDVDGGTVTGDVHGLYFQVDIESGVTSIGGSVYGIRIWVDADKDPTGSVYMLYLDEKTNVDYGIYQSGTALNYLGGCTGVGVSPDADMGIYISKVFTDTDNSGKAALRSEAQVAKTSAAMTSAGWGIYGQIILDSTNTQNWTHADAGLRAVCGYVGTETGSTGTITNAAGLFTLANIANAATITNLHGIHVCTPVVAGSKVTNEYGLYICDQNTGATLNYAIYTNAGTVRLGGDLDHDGTNVGFYSASPVAQQTGVAVSAAAIHAALVNLGLITA